MFDALAPRWHGVADGDRQRVLESMGRECAAIDWEKITKVDVALALLRVNTRSAIKSAEEILGVPIRQCPPAVPPWPPKAVARNEEFVSRVRKVAHPNPCYPGRDAHRRFALVREGMTEKQLLAKGVTRRDLADWMRKGYVEMTT